MDKRIEWRGALEWAQAKGKQSIEGEDLTPDQRQLAFEIWCLTGYKLDGAPYKIRKNTTRGNGLELWRKLCDEYDPKSVPRATAIKIKLQRMPVMTSPEQIKPTVRSLEMAFDEYDSMMPAPMDAGTKQGILIRIAPEEFIKPSLMSGSDLSDYGVLKQRLLTWHQGASDLVLMQGKGPSPMDLSHLGGSSPAAAQEPPKASPSTSAPPPTPAADQALLAAVRQNSQLLAALVKGKGKGKGDGSARPAASPGKGGNPDGTKGANTKPSNKDDPVQIRICRAWARHGECPRGQKCSFEHVSGLPESIVKKVLAKNSLTVAALGDGVKPTGTGEWIYTSTPSQDAAILAALDGVSAEDGQGEDGWAILGSSATDKEIDDLIAANSGKPF